MGTVHQSLSCCLLLLITSGVQILAQTGPTTQAPTTPANQPTTPANQPTTPANQPPVTTTSSGTVLDIFGPFFTTTPPPQNPTQNANANANSWWPWYFTEGGRNLALANLITSQFPGPAGALYANQVLDLPDGYLPYQLFQSALNQGNQGQGGSPMGPGGNNYIPYLFLLD